MKNIFLFVSLFCSSVSMGQAIYTNGFSATSASPSDPPSTINANLTSASWTISSGSFTSYAGATGEALSMGSASAITNTWTLPLTVNSGHSMSLTSFSFWNRASTTGYSNWQLDVNGTVIGNGTVSTSGASTGTVSIPNNILASVSNLTGNVNVHLIWSGGTHGATGTGRLDNFSLNGSVNDNGCTGTPVAGAVSAGNTSMCSGSSTTLTLTGASAGSGINYQWQSSADNTIWNSISNATNTNYITPTLTATTYYRCVTTCSSSGLSISSNAATITIISSLTPSVTIGATATSICASTEVTYTAAPVNGGINPGYQWRLGNSNITAATNSTYSYIPANGDAITCILTSNAQCTSPTTATSNDIIMVVNPLPTPTITGTTMIYPGQSTNITLSGMTGDIVNYWNGSTTVADTLPSTNAVVSVSPSVTTTYYISSATSAAGCMQTITGQSAIITITDTSVTPTRDNNLAMGNPSNATMAATDSNNYLMTKAQYTLSYNNRKGMANWVSWHLSEAWVGTATRCDCFTEDATLPSGYFKSSTANYTNTGFDRGHFCPSADRDASDTDNAVTFEMTNISPQSPMLNEGPWGDLEDYCRSLLSQGKELYIIAGGYGSGGTGSNGGITTSIASGHINVPDHFYKIILVLPVGSNDVSRVTKSTEVIAVIMPNIQTVSIHTWDYYRTTVDSIESITGYNFLSNVADSIQSVIEANTNSGGPNMIAAWDFTGANATATFAATTFNTNLDTLLASKNITRGNTAAANTGANSFRTTGFKNNGIATSNTDYFQTTIKAKSGHKVSLASINAAFQGTSSFYASPGVTSQFAYSLDGNTFTLIDTAITTTALSLNGIDLSNINSLQNVPDSVTITLRYYASGQTTTGGWGFYSTASGMNGLAIVGYVDSEVSPAMKYMPSVVSSISEHSLHVTMQPNPASAFLNINLSAPKAAHIIIRITDMQGRVVYYQDMGNLQQSTITVSMEDFKPGIYIAEIVSDSERLVRKIIKR